MVYGKGWILCRACLKDLTPIGRDLCELLKGISSLENYFSFFHVGENKNGF
jgi:hypothetical protein